MEKITDMPSKAKRIADILLQKTQKRPRIGLILGSGWGGIARSLNETDIIPYTSLPEMPSCGVEGHTGNFIFGSIDDTDVVILQGRFHLYEGRELSEVVLPIRILFELGIDTLFLTNAAGGLEPDFKVGDLMIINDHINLTAKNPLIGVKPTKDFPVFVDMTHVYDENLQKIISEECDTLNIGYRRGAYLQVLGPSYETPAEIRAFRSMGASAVGMSTVVEAIYARYLHMRIAAVSCITNLAAGLFDGEIKHGDVLEESDKREAVLAKLIGNLIRRF